MSSPIISVENLSKRYLVGHQSVSTERYTALRDVISKHVKNFGRKAWDMACGRQIIQGDTIEEFWALKDVSFDINEGEVVGIIGRNGAGKSTLLKVISRITEPTEGRIKLSGRVASLLEVGTGFHPELTGRENIFLNGAILGMGRVEIKKKFDEIVDFAGVEKFLDTPVKRYSSGMYVRLAFAVAAHLEPEILVVDEVLAVGDAEFQKKCLGKMQSVAIGGRTVIFVSHNMASITALCNKAILLVDGALDRYADTDSVIHAFCTNRNGDSVATDLRNMKGFRTEHFSFDEIEFASSRTVRYGGDLKFTLRCRLSPHCPEALISFGVSDLGNARIMTADSEISVVGSENERELNIQIGVKDIRLTPGTYWISLGARTPSGENLDFIGSCETFDVLPDEFTPPHIANGPRSSGIRVVADYFEIGK